MSWIKTSDKRPEPKSYVWATNNQGEIVVAFYGVNRQFHNAVLQTYFMPNYWIPMEKPEPPRFDNETGEVIQ